MEDLPKVTLLEDPDQNIHLKNLSLQQATNEEEALNFLFVGDTNRMIAETPMNQASTRSHCIFTIHLTSRQIGSTSLRKSKLHLVDLAGSERVAKSGANGLLLTEAKYINLSLHYLEQVIVALSEKNRSHIPYRNSMMTSVLRDSLGGNCMTSMIATCAVDKNNIDESISTCRFAQRVALIKNEAILNEEFDPKLMISKLKKEVNQLKEELALRTGDIREDELTSEEIQQCIDLVNQYLEDSDLEAVLDVGADMRKIQKCFDILKKRLEEQTARFQSETRSKETNAANHQDLDVSPYFSAEESKLKNIIMQRDNEISILVNMLKKEKQKNAELESNPRQKRHLAKESSFHTSPNSSQTSLQENSFTSEENINPDNVAYSDTWIDQSKSIQKNKENITHRQIYMPAQKRTHQKYDAARHRPRWTKKMKIDVVRCYFRAVVNAPTSCRRSMYRYWKQLYPDTTYTEQRIANQKRQIFSHVDNINRHSKKGRWLTKLEVEAIKMGPMSLGRQEAFDIFCQDYKDNKAIKMKKAELKEQYSKAKSLGEQVNKSRIRINQLKSKMEQHRLQCGLQGKLDPDNPDEAEQSLKNEIEKEKNKYKDNFNSLRNLKTEIEHCQHLLEKEKVQLMKAFEEWWAEQVNLVMLQEEQLQQQQEQLQQQQQEQQTQYYHNSVSPGQATSKLSQSSSLLSMQSINSNGPPTKDLPRRLSSTALNTHSAPYSTGQQPLTVARMSSAPVSYQRLKHGNIPLTGDAQVDSDIKAFVQARRNLLQMRSENK
eukprot:XP_014785830.1 PREDICTED: kinesin-like protein KIF6 isoform X1 [Octopus bimaculoides]